MSGKHRGAMFVARARRVARARASLCSVHALCPILLLRAHEALLRSTYGFRAGIGIAGCTAGTPGCCTATPLVAPSPCLRVRVSIPVRLTTAALVCVCVCAHVCAHVGGYGLEVMLCPCVGTVLGLRTATEVSTAARTWRSLARVLSLCWPPCRVRSSTGGPQRAQPGVQHTGVALRGLWGARSARVERAL